MAKKKRRSTGKTYKPISQKYLAKIFEAEEFMESGQWIEARDMLESLNRRHPNRPEVLTHLVNVSIELQDMESYQKHCEQLLEVTPDDPDVMLGLAGAYMSNVRPALAIKIFHRFLERWPDHQRANDVRNTAANLERITRENLAALGLSGEDALDIAESQEEVNSFLAQGKYAQACKAAEQLLERKPDLTPVLNNLSLVYFIEGRLEDALAAAERVLED
jgi:tetratricopeptide (TPR) repeat protein